jgi:hypothetical protein
LSTFFIFLPLVIAVLSCFCFNLLFRYYSPLFLRLTCCSYIFRVRNRLITTTSIPIEDLHFETVVEAVLGKWGKCEFN